MWTSVIRCKPARAVELSSKPSPNPPSGGAGMERGSSWKGRLVMLRGVCEARERYAQSRTSFLPARVENTGFPFCISVGNLNIAKHQYAGNSPYRNWSHVFFCKNMADRNWLKSCLRQDVIILRWSYIFLLVSRVIASLYCSLTGNSNSLRNKLFLRMAVMHTTLII